MTLRWLLFYPKGGGGSGGRCGEPLKGIKPSERWIEGIYQCSNSSLQESSLLNMDKAMATHSSALAWKIPWVEEPGRLQSMGSWRVGHDWATSLSLFTFMHWRRKWQPIPVFLPGESQGWRSLVGCRLWGPTESDAWGCTESDTTEVT